VNPDIKTLFFTFLKLGFISFGGPVAHIALMERELVNKLNWISHEKFLNFISMSNLIPGPLFSSSAYIGYIFAGIPGALTAAAGIFLPAFIFVYLISKFYNYVAEKKNFKIFLNYLNVSSVALILYMCYLLSIETFVDSQTELYKLIIMFFFSGFLFFKFKNINTAIVILLSLLLSALLNIF